MPRADDLELTLARDARAGRSDRAQSSPHAVKLRISGALRRYRTISMGLALSDVVCVVGALMISYRIRYSTRPMPVQELAVVLVAPILWVGVFRAFNLYAPQHLSPPEEFRRVIGATSLGIVLLVMASYWSKSSFARTWVGLTWVLVLVFELTARRVWEWYEERLKEDGRLAFQTLIVGSATEAARLAEILKAPASGFTPLGYVGACVPSAPADPLPFVGGIEDLRQLVHDQAADCLFVASGSISAQDMSRVAQVARQEGVEVRVSANLPQTLTSRLTLQTVGGAIALSLRPVRRSSSWESIPE